MATAFLLLSGEKPGDDGRGAASGEIDPIPAKPKGRKTSRTAAPKRPPQRGLGVAQLERIRLGQERWKTMIPGPEPVGQPRECQPLPIYLPAAVSVGFRGGNYYPSPSSPVQPSPTAVGPICFVQRCHSPALQPWVPGFVAGTPAVGSSGASAVRSVLHEQYALDRYRAGGAAACGVDARFGPVIGGPLTELPSNQSSKPLQCGDSDECEFCVRKKRLFGYDLVYDHAGNCVDYLKMELTAGQESDGYPRKGKVGREQVKELEFFPPSRSASSGCDFSSELGGDRMAGDASSSSSSSAGASPHLLDLSLKLSL